MGGQQSFRGRGPKGYQRSDERLKELISEKLSDDHRIDASEVEVEVSGGEVTLKGTVDQRWTKHEIEEITDRCGVKEINNQIRVKSKESGSSVESTGSKSGITGQHSSQGDISRPASSNASKKN